MKRGKDRREPRPQARRSTTLSRAPTPSPGQLRVFDLVVEPDAPPRWPAISACMIVRNEAANIRPCLESLQDLASQIVVVDTGSTDDTVEIAREMGATVHFFPWVEDFAAARNESIRHATGDWIFWLDADDRLSPTAVNQLKRVAASGEADAYMCLVPSPTGDGSEHITEHIRLFRNGLGIRFSFAVHETVYPDLVRLGLRLAYTDIAIQHTGYLSPEAKMRKARRNLAILEQQIKLKPTNVDLIFYRGQARGHMGDAEGLADDMQAYLERTKPGSRFDFKRFWAYTSLLSVLDLKGDRQELERVAREALVEFPRHPNFLFTSAILLAIRGQIQEATEQLLAVHQSLQGPVQGRRPPRAVVEAHIADCYRALGRTGEAIEWAEKAWACDRNSAKAGTILARLRLEQGSIREAEAVLDQLIPSASIPESWLVLAELRLRQGRYGEAASALLEAGDRGLPKPQIDEFRARLEAAEAGTPEWTRRRAGSAGNGASPVGSASALGAAAPAGASPGQSWLPGNGSNERHLQGIALEGLNRLGQGRHLEAAECFASAIEANPSDPQNYRYLAVALRNLGREEEALEAWRLSLRWQARGEAANGGLAAASQGG